MIVDIGIAGYWALAFLFLIFLPTIPALIERSWRRLFIAGAVTILGIMIPLFVFSASALLVPEWKGDCPHGAIDCFHVGKLALLPLVLWASAALYASQALGTRYRRRPWVSLGVFVGSIVSTVCCWLGIAVMLDWQLDVPLVYVLIVPLYVAVWYVILTVRLARESTLRFTAYLYTVLGSLPFFAAGFYCCRRYYLALPDEAPDCFVVTATQRGHESIVGPFTIVRRGARFRAANRQLLAFWHLEAVWQQLSPYTHRIFRRIYNRVGPVVARRVTTPLAADIVYLALKPMEWVAVVVCLVLRLFQTRD